MQSNQLLPLLHWLPFYMLCITLGCSTSEKQEQDPPPTNFVIILCDDLGYGDLEAFAGTHIRSPRLTALCAKGLKLTHCYSGSPVCSPARGALFTGRNPNRLGIRDWIPEGSGIYLDTAEVTLPELLQGAGYATGLIGKWHLNSLVDGSEPGPLDHGFDFAMYTQNNANPTHQNPDNFIRGEAPLGILHGHSTTLTMDTAWAWIQRQTQPFAAFITLHAPHEPLATPAEWKNMYQQFPDSTQQIYYGAVSLIDHAVGKLLDSLETHGLMDNTLLFFTSDNGPETLDRYEGAERSHGSPGPLRGMKLHITEAGYRVPGILYWPGHTTAGTVSSEPIASYDLLPTLAAIANIPLPNSLRLDGANFLPMLEQQPIAREHSLYWQFDNALSSPLQVSLRSGRWKLLADTALTHFELYDLVADAGESENLVGQHPQVVEALKEELISLYEEINGGDLYKR